MVLNKRVKTQGEVADMNGKYSDINSFRFSVAPMMDWTNRLEKVKAEQAVSLFCFLA